MDPFIDDKHQAACLWRSIILSSLDATLYPYCAYIRALSLSSLAECLEDMRNHRQLRDFFFGGLMQDFVGCQDRNKALKDAASRNQIPIQCADSITKYIKNLADTNGSSVALTHLEASTFPPEILPVWICRLATLKSLQLQDGSILDVEIGNAIAESCPKFAELICLHCSSDTAAEDMAAFFRALRPATLQRFEVFSRNSLSAVTLASLINHSTSLRVLNLRSLQRSAVRSLGLLSRCTGLEKLLIERDATDRGGPDIFNEAELDQVATWISNCKRLRELNIAHVPEALTILKEVLCQPEIKLEQLAIHDFRSASKEVTKATWSALTRQDELVSLTIAAQDGLLDGLVLDSHPELVDAICQLTNLDVLNLMQVKASSHAILLFAMRLPRLKVLSFGGDLFYDDILGPLSRLHSLVSLSINALTFFSYEAFMRFAQSLDPLGNSGIRVDVLNQSYTDPLVPPKGSQGTQLEEYFVERLNGQLIVTYSADPNELAESDFTDSD